MSLPKWANAPTKTAKATSKGWVEHTGELLVSHKGLADKINALGGQTPSEIAVEAAEEGAEKVAKATSKKKKKK